MIPSIRTFLLVNLLLSVTLITSLAIIGNLFLEHKDLRHHLDGQLTFTALTIQALVQDTSPGSMQKVQRQLNQVATAIPTNYCQNKLERSVCLARLKPFFEKVQFQVWDKSGKIVLHSLHSPLALIQKPIPGFSDQTIEGKPWRMFVAMDPHDKNIVAVAERYTFRDQLEAQITQDSILIMLIMYPFLGLLIWIVVGRGLASIKRVANAVKHRAATYLEPVDLEEVPPEIQPLVNELNELFIRLHAAFYREKRFAADAAHELRTPLAALRAQTQVALNTMDPNDLKTSLTNIIKCVDRSTHVVQQLLTMSRMVPEAAIKEMGSVAINKEAIQIIADLVPVARKKNITIELEAPEKDINVLGNATALGILMRNLIDNAIRYTPENGKVVVIIEQRKKKIKLHVVDNGPGIPEELRERVFERFFRVVGTQASGSGLGLGIVQQIVQMHRAKIELAAPKSGHGLEVVITFIKPSKT